MPVGSETTPEGGPGPAGGARTGVCPTGAGRIRSFVIAKTHDPVPVQSPDHPSKIPVPGVAFSWTGTPGGYTLLHLLPQSMPPASDFTVPVPPPAFTTVSLKLGAPGGGFTVGGP